MVADCEPTLALALRRQIATIVASLGLAIPVEATDDIRMREPSWRIDAHDIVLLQYTSGSTGRPRGVVIRHDNIIANARALIDHVPVGVTWLPQFHDMGLIGHYLFPIVMGGRSHGLAPVDFVRQPSLWLRLISQHRATFAAAPPFGFEHCLRCDAIADSDLQGIDLGSLKVLMGGAEPVPPDTCRRFFDRFRYYGLARSVLVAAYGLAEATLAVTRGSPRTSKFDADRLADGVAIPPTSDRVTELCSCGPPLANLKLQICSPETGALCGDGMVGEICVTGASVARGYWSDVAAGGERSNLRTRDLGFIHSGELYVCGRADDLIIRHGRNHHPQDIEAIVDEGATRRRSSVVFQGKADQVILLLETQPGRPLPDPIVLAARIAIATCLSIDRVVIAPPRSIATTTSGKLARAETRRRLDAGLISRSSTSWWRLRRLMTTAVLFAGSLQR